MDPDVPPCVGGVIDPHVRAYLDISREGAMWVGRTASHLGDFELRIQGHNEGIRGTEVSGSVKGTAIDTAYPFGLRGLHPEFALTLKVGAETGSAGSVTGRAEPTGDVSGTIAGDTQYVDGLGNVTKCAAVIWSLAPAPSPLS
jgi:hypothetical protein